MVGGVIGGVGQRMLTGVAKKMAGEFFAGVDDVLTGKAPAAEHAAVTDSDAGWRPAGAAPAVYQAPGAATRTGADCRATFMLGALFGAAAALLGVLVGARTARSESDSRLHAMREFVAAAVQLAPDSAPLTAETIAGNTERAIELVRRCVAATGAELVVLPESVTTGFTTGRGRPRSCGDLVSEMPGPILEPFSATELPSWASTWWWEPTSVGPNADLVYNAAVVLGPAGELLGIYRKTHPFGTERADRGGWVTPGEDILVVDTDARPDRRDHLLRRRLSRSCRGSPRYPGRGDHLPARRRCCVRPICGS